MELIFQPLSKNTLKKDFDCGDLQLNAYLKQNAGQHSSKNISKTYVLVRTEDNKVAGFYSISMSSIPFSALPENQIKGLPKYPLPAMLIGQLARDLSFKGQDLGQKLLLDALKKAFDLSDEIGIFAVRVDALSEKAKNFYLGFDFIPFIEEENSLFLPMTIVKKLF